LFFAKKGEGERGGMRRSVQARGEHWCGTLAADDKYNGLFSLF